MKLIFCDESGFTGPNLLDVEQPEFVYASVETGESAAFQIISELRNKFSLDLYELKGKNLVRHSKGQSAISYLMSLPHYTAKLARYDKLYSLCSKFYEYIFEPVLAKRNTIFYSFGLHKYIANMLYFMHFDSETSIAQIAMHFQSLLKDLDLSFLEKMLAHKSREKNIFFDDVLTFMTLHRKTIEDNLLYLRNHDFLSKWVLDLTTSALYGLLCCWGEENDELMVYCDDSKPLKDSYEMFNTLIGRKGQLHLNYYDKISNIIFNLKQPIQLVRSESFPGIQIADILARTINFVQRNPKDHFSQDILPLIKKRVFMQEVGPESHFVNSNHPASKINLIVLSELVSRSQRGADLLSGWDDFIRKIASNHPHLLLALGKVGM